MDENLVVNISEDQDFMSLQPGGSWIFSPMNYLDDVDIGNSFPVSVEGSDTGVVGLR